jgi:hypothetical protein
VGNKHYQHRQDAKQEPLEDDARERCVPKKIDTPPAETGQSATTAALANRHSQLDDVGEALLALYRQGFSPHHRRRPVR